MYGCEVAVRESGQGGFLFGCSDGAEGAEVGGMGWEARGFGLALGIG
jgi:hypothetical protein